MPLWFALFTLCLIALAVGSTRSAAGAAYLLLNWCACTVAAKFFVDPSIVYPKYPYLIWAAFDLITGCLILAIPFSRMQFMLGCTYVFGLLWHAWYAYRSDPPQTDYFYANGLHSMAWSQLWIAVLWTGHDVLGLARRGRYPWRNLLVRWPSLLDMARRK